jgi:N-methylhydantoinase A
MHAAALGAELQVKCVVVPPHSGVFSAWGMGLAEARADAAQTHVIPASASTASALDAVFARLELEVTAELTAQSTAPESVRRERSADMRYRGQEHAVRVPVAPGPVSAEAMVADFHALHRQKYTFDLEGDPVEIVTCHVSGLAARPSPPAPSPARTAATPAEKGRRRVDFDADGVHEAAVFDRSCLPPGFSARGPVVVEDETTTALVHPGQTLEVDEAENLVVWLR